MHRESLRTTPPTRFMGPYCRDLLLFRTKHHRGVRLCLKVACQKRVRPFKGVRYELRKSLILFCFPNLVSFPKMSSRRDLGCLGDVGPLRNPTLPYVRHQSVRPKLRLKWRMHYGNPSSVKSRGNSDIFVRFSYVTQYLFLFTCTDLISFTS